MKVTNKVEYDQACLELESLFDTDSDDEKRIAELMSAVDNYKFPDGVPEQFLALAKWLDEEVIDLPTQEERKAAIGDCIKSQTETKH